MTEKQAMVKMASYCSKAERSEYDVRKKLLAYEIKVEEINNIVRYLQKENYLSEERYCRSFIKDKARFNKWGRNKIVFELKKKNITESLISNCLNEQSVEEFEESLLMILETKIKSVKAVNEYDRKAKLFRFALGRGYPSDMIQRCLSKLLKDSLDDCFF